MSRTMIAAIVPITLLAGLAHGDVPSLPAPVSASTPPALRLDPTSLDRAIYDRHRALIMRNAGIALTVVGGVGLVAGAVTIASCSGHDGCYGNLVYGAMTLGIAAVPAVTGIPLWVIGQKRADRAVNAVMSFSAGGVRLTF